MSIIVPFPQECSICLEDIEDIDEINIHRVKCCKQAFHKTCFMHQMAIKPICPLCRAIQKQPCEPHIMIRIEHEHEHEDNYEYEYRYRIQRYLLYIQCCNKSIMICTCVSVVIIIILVYLCHKYYPDGMVSNPTPMPTPTLMPTPTPILK